ncbi:hypothetical protein MYX64_05585 [Nitrospinae bacterium AH_259_B05_G02_I21]|nr:hypothetical protein [Nitrospinae bacterium AH_259_B05_G02_I21]
MPHHGYLHYSHEEIARRRRLMLWLTTLVVGVGAFIAWNLPTLIAGWNKAAESGVHQYVPHDFERHAWLAGQRLGAEQPHLTKAERKKIFEKELEHLGIPGAIQGLEGHLSTFEAGHEQGAPRAPRDRRK